MSILFLIYIYYYKSKVKMGKITTQELEEMIKSKFLEKGVSNNDIKNNFVEEIADKIKAEVNKGIKDRFEPKKEVVDVDISSNESPESFSSGVGGGNITSDSFVNKEMEENVKKEVELKEIEKLLSQKEEELKLKEEELNRKEEDLKYRPTLPEKIETINPEKLFLFDENKLSVGSENLSRLEFNLLDSPESKINMHELWLKDAIKKAEIYIVKYDKIGDIEFNPIEGTTSFKALREEDVETISPEEAKVNAQGNMIDSIAPVKEVILPPLENNNIINSLENSTEEESEENLLLKNKVEEMIKNYLSKNI